MAKKNTTAQSAAKPAKTAKVAKLDKAAKAAKAAKADKPAKPAKVSGQQAKRRASIATKTIRLTKEGRAFEGYRGARGECWELVVKNDGKPVANVVGQPYTGRGGAEREFDTSFIAFFVGEGLLTLVD